MDFNWVNACYAVVTHPLSGVLITLLCYQLAQWIYRYSGYLSLLHPVLVGLSLVIAVLLVFDISYASYIQSAQLLSLLLGAATVALAVPLYNHFHRVRSLFWPLLLTLFGSAVFAVVSVVGIAWLLGADEKILMTLAPKSVTTPVAIILSKEIGGYASLTAIIVSITGILGAVLAQPLFKILGVKDQATKGIVLGISAHAVGTAKAFELSGEAGAFAGLVMGLMSVITALLLPLLLPMLLLLLMP